MYALCAVEYVYVYCMLNVQYSMFMSDFCTVGYVYDCFMYCRVCLCLLTVQ